MKQNRTCRDGVNIRLPDGMRDEIQRRAKENHRSMNAEIVYHLEQTKLFITEKTAATKPDKNAQG